MSPKKLPALRPLAGYDKEEIIALARRIGTYEESIRKYKDCCSIISRRASTAVKPEEMRQANRAGGAGGTGGEEPGGTGEVRLRPAGARGDKRHPGLTGAGRRP